MSETVEQVSYIELDEEDVVRHKLVKAIIKAYNKDDEKNMQQKELEKEREKK